MAAILLRVAKEHSRYREQRECGKKMHAQYLSWQASLPTLPARQQYPTFPKPLGDIGGHRRRLAKRLMNTNKIIVHRKQRNRMRLFFNLLRKAVCQPGKAASVHPNAEIAAFDI